MAPKKEFVSVNLTPDARDHLRIASLQIGLDLRRKVSMADALLILNAVAQRHPDEIKEEGARLFNRDVTTEGEQE